MNYDEIVDASKAYADRYDIAVDENMNVFILLTESRVNRLLKTRKQSVRYTMSAETDREFYDLPEDWAGMRDLSAIVYASPIDFTINPYTILDPKTFTITSQKPSDGCNYYAIIANQLNIFPSLSNGDVIEMVYYQKVPNLREIIPGSPGSNWLSDDHPDIYIAGMCAEISLFAKDYDAAQTWYNRLSTAVGELDNVDWVERWSGDPLQIRLAQ